MALSRDHRCDPCALFGTSILAEDGLRLLEAGTNRPVGVGVGANLAYAIAASGFLVSYQGAVGGSRIRGGDGGTAPALEDQISLFFSMPEALRARIAFVNSGTNNYSVGTAASEFEKNRRQIDRLIEAGMTVYVLELPPRANTNAALEYAWVTEFNALHHQAYGARVVPIFPFLTVPSGLSSDTPRKIAPGVTSDNIHPDQGTAGARLLKAISSHRELSPALRMRSSTGIELPYDQEQNFVLQFDGSGGTFPSAGNDDWNVTNAGGVTITPVDPIDGKAGFQFAFALTGTASFATFQLHHLVPGRRYLFSATHEVVSADKAVGGAIRLNFTGNGTRSTLLNRAYWPTGIQRTAVSFVCPAGAGTPQIEIGALTAATGNFTIRVWDVNVHELPY